VLPPRTNRPRVQSASNRFLQLSEIDAFVLPERIVFRDEDRALQIRRHAA